MALNTDKKLRQFLDLILNTVELADGAKEIGLKHRDLKHIFLDEDNIRQYLKYCENKKLIELVAIAKKPAKYMDSDDDSTYITELNPDAELLMPGQFYMIRRYNRINFYPVDQFIIRVNTKNIKSALKTSNQKADKGKFLIIRDKNGNYFYNGIEIKVDKENMYYKVFDIVFIKCNPDGDILYKDIEEQLVKRGEPKSKDTKQRNTRIYNSIINPQQGFFRFVKLDGGKKVKEIGPDGKNFFEIIRGRGIKFHNPAM